MLIAAAPAWSQSLLKRLDPDKDGHGRSCRSKKRSLEAV
jgi:hypothetical protein